MQSAEVDGFGGVRGVGDGDGFGGALVADGQVAEELFGLSARAVDFLLAEAYTALLLGLVLVAIQVVASLPPQSVGLPMLLDALCLALLVRLGFCLGLCLCVGRLLRLLALDLGVFGGVP